MSLLVYPSGRLRATRNREGRQIIVPFMVRYETEAEGYITPVEALGATGLPQYGDYLNISGVGTDTTLICVDVSLDEDSGFKRIWRPVCTFSTAAGIEVTQADNPLDRAPDWTFTANTSEEPVEVDINGDPVMNSAGVRFDPQPTETVYDAVLRIQRNVATTSLTGAAAFWGAVNSSAFTIYHPQVGLTYSVGARQALCRQYDIRPAYENGVNYYIEDIELVLRIADDWDRVILDAGYTVRNGSNELQVPTDTNNYPLNCQVMLDGAGAEEPDPDASGATYLVFQTKRQADFSILNLRLS